MIEIIFDSKGDGHRDIFINITDINFSSDVDSYYLCIDHLFMPDDESSDKVKKCLELMISSWISTIERLEVNQTVYLPYEFSDQYVGVFMVHKKMSDEISFRPGFTTKYEGHQISPALDTSLHLHDEDFASNENECLFSKAALVFQLDTALRVL